MDDILQNSSLLITDPATPGTTTLVPLRWGSDLWTIPMLCIGLSIVAACVVAPQGDANRQLTYERQKMTMDLDQIAKQSQVNQEFLLHMQNDPQLTQRLVERMMRVAPQGEKVVLSVSQDGSTDPINSEAAKMSPFGITQVALPESLAPYEPAGGIWGKILLSAQARLYLLASGLLLIAGGLVMGKSPDKIEAAAA